MNKEKKKEYQSLLVKLTEILYALDPIGIVDDDMPNDEYMPEAGKIIPRLREANSPEGLSVIMYQVFAYQFDEKSAGCPSKYISAAKEFWKFCEQYGIK